MAQLAIEDLRNLLGLCDTATSGPWHSFIEGRDLTSGSNFIRTGAGDIELSGGSGADQDFIAAARQAVPVLIYELARAKGWEL